MQEQLSVCSWQLSCGSSSWHREMSLGKLFSHEQDQPTPHFIALAWFCSGLHFSSSHCSRLCVLRGKLPRSLLELLLHREGCDCSPWLSLANKKPMVAWEAVGGVGCV